MSKNTQDASKQASIELAPTELEELKRDMRSAQFVAWLERHRQRLLIGLLALVVVLVGFGLWQQRGQEQSAAAAQVYMQALQERDEAKRISLFKELVASFPASAYAAMAHMQLAALEPKQLEPHLQAVIEHARSMDMWRWQARLDLADWQLQQGRKDAARALLQERMGKAYEQRRHYLLALLAEDAASRRAHLRKAQEAESYDAELKRTIERMLAEEERKS